MSSPTILVGVEGEREGRDAVALGCALARTLGARLLLGGVYAPVYGINAYDYEMAAREEVQARLKRARQAVTPGVTCETRAIASPSVVRGLHELAEKSGAEAIVIGPTHRGPAARAFGGDVTLALLHAAPCAVAVAPAGHADEPRPVDVVGVGYLPTREGREALDSGIALAERAGANLRILHAGLASDATRELLEDARLEAPTGMDVETVILSGLDPADLLRTASADLDLLVIGSRGYGPARRVLAGSVSGAVVHGAACPVLVLPRGVTIPSRVEARAGDAVPQGR